MEKYNEIKAILTAVFAGISAKMGWFGWLIVIYGLSMAMDYATGSALAVKQRRWSSYAAREGLWHKLGSIVENVGEMGAPVPGFLRRAIAALQDAAEQTGDQLTVDREEKEK